MQLTVEEFLTREQEKGMRCIAGFQGLSNVITGFTIMDVPNVAEWLKGGELVVSAGYFTSEVSEDYEFLIMELVAHKCSAFGVKMHYYHEEIPTDFIHLANKYGLPLIELNYALRFSDIAYSVHRNMFLNEMQMEQKMQFFYPKIMKSIFSEAGTEQVLYYMNLLLQRPVYLLDSEYRCIEWESDICMKPEKGKRLFWKQQCLRLADRFEEMHFKSHLFENEERKGEWFVIAPIEYEQELQGFLLVHEEQRDVPQEQYQMIEKLVEILGVYFEKNRILGGNIARGVKNFLNTVLLPSTNTEENIRHYAALYGFPSEKKRVCINFKICDYFQLSYAKRQNIRNILSCMLGEALLANDKMVYRVLFENNYSLFVFFKREESKSEVIFVVEQIVQQLLEKMKKYEWRIKVGISNISTEVSQIPQAYKQSIEMIALGEKIRIKQDIYCFWDMEIDYSLWNGHTQQELRELAEPIWKLYQYDLENHFEGIETLEIYMKNKYNVTKTAAELHLHRNSLMYRLGKIQEVLEIDLENQNELFHLQLGMHALRLIQEE